jgi:serine/threonine protein kinase
MAAHDRTEWVSAPPAESPQGAEGPAGSRIERLGPYRLIEEIGEGGMGVVHLAIDPRGRAVAIKVLRAHVAHDADARTRLGREVDTLSRVRDPRVASVIDADIMGPRPYVVTRYVPGPALDETVEDQGPLAPAELLRLARGTAEAIRAIHACGVVHRDIKPGNVLLEDGEPVLIDFGIAHLQDDVRHTVGGLVMGTPGYLSPELVEGAAITDATDWWGWAATITYAASGRPPFGRGRMDAVLSRVRAGEVDLEGVDPRLAPLLRASLSPNPFERPHADQVIAALERYAHGQEATVPTPNGGSWDAHGLPVTPPGSTQVFQERGTAVLPSDDVPASWPPPSGPVTPAAAPSPAAYVRLPPAAVTREEAPEPVDPHAGHDDYDDGHVQEDEPAEIAPREGDPRIGKSMRTALLLGLATAWLGALAAWPSYAVLALFAWSTVARATDRTVTGLVVRRYDHGRRRGDVPWAVALSPVHLALGAVATLVGLLLPAAVALAGVFAATLLLSGSSGEQPGPGTPVTLVTGGILGLLMLWMGPGSASLRRGSRSIVRRLVPQGLASQIVTGVLIGVGLVLAAVAMGNGASITWEPLSGNPFGP